MENHFQNVLQGRAAHALCLEQYQKYVLTFLGGKETYVRIRKDMGLEFETGTPVICSCAQIVCLLNDAQPLFLFPILVKTTFSSTWLMLLEKHLLAGGRGCVFDK